MISAPRSLLTVASFLHFFSQNQKRFHCSQNWKLAEISKIVGNLTSPTSGQKSLWCHQKSAVVHIGACVRVGCRMIWRQASCSCVVNRETMVYMEVSPITRISGLLVHDQSCWLGRLEPAQVPAAEVWTCSVWYFAQPSCVGGKWWQVQGGLPQKRRVWVSGIVGEWQQERFWDQHGQSCSVVAGPVTKLSVTQNK